MAPSSSGTSSSLSCAIRQNHFHQTRISCRHPLQPQISCGIVVPHYGTSVLLPRMAQIQKGGFESQLNSLGPVWIFAWRYNISGTHRVGRGLSSKQSFSSKRDFVQSLQRGLQRWCKENGLPSIPKHQCLDLGQDLCSTHTSYITHHITRSSIQPWPWNPTSRAQYSIERTNMHPHWESSVLASISPGNRQHLSRPGGFHHGWPTYSSLWLARSTSPQQMSIIFSPFYVRLPNMEISSFTIRTSLGSSPASTNRGFLELGTCHTWMSVTAKSSLSIWGEATTLKTSSRDGRFDVWMSHGRSSSRTFQICFLLL